MSDLDTEILKLRDAMAENRLIRIDIREQPPSPSTGFWKGLLFACAFGVVFYLAIWVSLR